MVDDPRESPEQAVEEARVPPPYSFEQAVHSQACKGFAQLPLTEIAARARAASVPEDVLARARSKLQEPPR